MSEKKILVVDDEENIRGLFEMFFSRNGYEVVTASDGEEALEILKKNKIHVMFLDLNLPGMSGLELCKKIKYDEPACICHAVTGFTSVFELTNCREAGFDDYFVKPVKVELMLSAAKQAFEKIERWRTR